MKIKQRIRNRATQLGFELVGIVPSAPVPDYDFFLQWLDRGFAGTMEYLKKRQDRRGDPSKILPGVRSVICCGLNYHVGRQATLISSYAWGTDYHRVVGDRLKALEYYLREEIDPQVRSKSYVDTGPVLEKSYAARAGLGWIGKNTCLINNGIGSYFFLGEILTTLSFEDEEYDRPVLDQCGTCTRCLDACPTGALGMAEPYVMDANRCISYLTIEHKGDFTPEQEVMVGDHLYGCDICQQVCPYNDRISSSPLPEFQPRPGLVDVPLSEFESWDGDGFREKVRDSAMSRITYPQWRRNLEAVKKNQGKP